ncbi:hypothetical protein [Chitinivorax sp. B]|uniref:hypothetical protein n=1 Tax=Chitinivorax sp. B TaxID=2502235 RepID=UPI0010F8E9EA|nr:hypothetical protein [Chitinivorax sp. B]
MKRLAHLLCMSLLAATPMVSASGSWEPESRFFANQIPDRSIASQIQHLGGIYPEYRIAFLVHAYLALNQLPLPAQLADDMDFACCDQYRDYTSEAGGAAQEWTDAAQDLLGDSNVPDAAKWFEGQYMESLNCYADAFRNATNTLEARQKAYPQDSKWLKEWATGQNIVFENCDKQHIAPPDVPANAPAWLRADRAYQQAAATFYQGEYNMAAQRFAAIAKDTRSPWSGIAPYLQARALVRMLAAGTDLGSGKQANSPEQQKLAQTVEQLLTSILKDAKRENLHSRARRLLRHTQVLTLPADTLLDGLGTSLRDPIKASRSDLAADFRSDLATLSTAYYRVPNHTRKPAKDDLIQWLDCMKSRYNATDPSPFAALARNNWQQTRKTHWLLAAMWLNDPTKAEFTPLMEAAQILHRDPSNQAYLPISLQLARALYLKQDWPVLRTVALALQQHPAVKESPSEQNIVKSLLLPTAISQEEFKKWAARQVVERVDPESGKQQAAQGTAEQQWDTDAVKLFNQLPLVTMVRLAENQVIVNEKTNLGSKGIWELIWSRAALLEDWPVARHAASMQLKQLAAANQPAPSLLKQFAEATDPIQLKKLHLYRFAAKDEVVTPPLMPQDSIIAPAPLLQVQLTDIYYDYNSYKWCTLTESSQTARHIPQWLTDTEKQAAAAEQAKLAAIPPDSVYYGQATMAFAKTTPDDPEIPHMLSIAVKMSRYACRKPEVGTTSKQAFQLLKSKYGKSEWATQTKYWFEGR